MRLRSAGAIIQISVGTVVESQHALRSTSDGLEHGPQGHVGGT
jgi:hypothetical protein